MRERRGTWFDPRSPTSCSAGAATARGGSALRAPDVASYVTSLEPAEHVRRVDDEGLDDVARAFADIIDAKSPYTFRHSTNVAEYARGIAAACGLDAAEQRRLYRAGLLHDIGKLGVSNRILDSPARLTAEEREAVERHPLLHVGDPAARRRVPRRSRGSPRRTTRSSTAPAIRGAWRATRSTRRRASSSSPTSTRR